MSFYQSDQVVRRGHPRGDSLNEPLMYDNRGAGGISNRGGAAAGDTEGQTVVNPLHGTAAHSPLYGGASGGAAAGPGAAGAYPYTFQATAQQTKNSCFRCKVVTVLLLLAGVSWSTYDFLYGARDDLEPAHMSWVTINGTEFMADCRPFLFAGFNTDNLKEAVVVQTQWSSYIGKTEGQMLIRRTMQQAAAAGLSVVRTWGHTTNPDFALQMSPGRYSEKAFYALDTVIDEARRAGLRIIITFVDNWKYYGGVDEFVDWSPTVTPRKKEYPPVNIQGDNTPADFDEVRKDYETARHALFYTDENCKKMYKNHVRTVLERVNVINGLAYKDDPTILGWSLINEPRCETWKVANCMSYLQQWLEEMAKYVKSIDSNHLLTIGEEGFFARDSPRVAANPADWGALMGQNFTGNHEIPEIDFVTVHTWPDNWDNYTYEFFSEWVTSHVEEATHVLKKPLVLQEFGKKMTTRDRKREVLETRDPVYRMAYRIFHENLAKASVLRGIMFWKLGVEVYERSGPGEYGVKFSDTTWPIIVENSRLIKDHVHRTAPDMTCPTECWVASTPKYGMFNQCTQRPSACRALSGKYENETARTAPSGRVYTSEFECCKPGTGAFPKGCSVRKTKPSPSVVQAKTD